MNEYCASYVWFFAWIAFEKKHFTCCNEVKSFDFIGCWEKKNEIPIMMLQETLATLAERIYQLKIAAILHQIWKNTSPYNV